MFLKIDVLINSLCWSLFKIKLHPWRIDKRLQHRCFPVKFAKYLRTLFFTEHLRWLLLGIYYIIFLVFHKMSYLCSLILHILLDWNGIVFIWLYFIFNFLFFCYIVVLFVNNKQNMLILFKANPLCEKRGTCE